MGAPLSPTDRTSLRAARLAAGLSRDELAVAACVSSKTVARLERGERTPYRLTRRSLAAALGLDPDALRFPDNADGRRASLPTAVQKRDAAAPRVAA